MSWAVENPVYNSITTYTATVTHTNGVSFEVKYAGAGFDSDTDVDSSFRDLADMIDASADFTLQRASRNKAGSDIYTP